MPRFLLTDQAKEDIREIAAFLREQSPAAAKLVRTKLREAMGQLAASPGMGHDREDVTAEPVRFWAVYSYLIVYRPDTRPLHVIAVVHGARDLPRQIKRRLEQEP